MQSQNDDPQAHMMASINIAFLLISILFFTHDYYFEYLLKGRFLPDIWRLIIQFGIGILGLILLRKGKRNYVALQTTLTPCLIYFIWPAFIQINVQEMFYINSLALPACIVIPIMVFNVRKKPGLIIALCLFIFFTNSIFEYYLVTQKNPFIEFKNFYRSHLIVLTLAKIAACTFFYFTFISLIKKNNEHEAFILERNKLLQLSNNVIRLQKEEIENQNTELLGTHGELNRINENLEIIIRERTSEVENKNRKLVEYAYLNSHILRGPFARLKGLINLIQLTEDNAIKEEYMGYFKITVEEVDDVIVMITKILNNEAPEKLSQIQDRVQKLYSELEREN